jgi:hypothetical protein
MRQGLVLLILLVAPGPAWGQWSIVSELAAAQPGRAFQIE